MRAFSISLLTVALFTTSALAGYNCKCQDSNGQYNELTAECCNAQNNPLISYPGGNHQCTSSVNAIDSGAFVQCCQGKGVGGAYCWN
ncbi:hypothetical protein OE88DRAFT_1738871 [Heliocybe sulcata]|uniref:Uncharacterized protein n=1 Tax=Heliocybe sulcata TaxID=5364 RepID=A0A5C3MQT1_9AGAM|nr:hypothetical protein OE88DRAFT_1738871 [Heliocybe sulcata]